MTNPLVTMPYIPDDLLLNCLARLSRLYYPTLSLVSKRFHSLVASLDLYETRKLLGRTENCLYLCIHLNTDDTTRWYTLSRRSTQIPNPNPNPNSRWFTPFRWEKEKSSDYIMVSVPTHNFSPPIEWARAAIGYNVYTIGGYYSNEFLSRVYSMNCRSHTWHEAPSMQTPREDPHVSVLDGKIYVVDGCKDPDSSNFIECFDPETQIWEYVPSPSAEILESIKLKRCLVIQGKLYLFGDNCVVYTSKEKRWDVVSLLELPLVILDSDSYCVIDNVVYMYNELCKKLFWCDSEGISVGYLKGLEELIPRIKTCVELVNYGGNIVVLWEEKVCGIKKTIWCAEIALERRGKDIYGKIEWCEVVLTLSELDQTMKVISVTV